MPPRLSDREMSQLNGLLRQLMIEFERREGSRPPDCYAGFPLTAAGLQAATVAACRRSICSRSRSTSPVWPCSRCSGGH